MNYWQIIKHTLVKSNELNQQKIRELVISSVKGSFNILNEYDKLNIVVSILFVFYMVFVMVKCSVRTDLFVLSVLFSLAGIIYTFIYFKDLKGKIFVKSIFDESNLSQTLTQLKEYQNNLISHLAMFKIFIPIIYVFFIPVLMHTHYQIYYLDTLKWQIEKMPILIPLEVIALAIVSYLVGKSFDWIYFPIIKKIEKNLEQLEE
jgi:Na+/proline symporter